MYRLAMCHALCEVRSLNGLDDMKITRFEDIKVWQLANKLSSEVSELVKTFPRYEKYDLVSQMRRSARSIPSDISEGFGRFHFNDKLTFYERARASLGELRNHFKEALINEYIDEVVYERYIVKMNEIGFLLNRLMRNVRVAGIITKRKRKKEEVSPRKNLIMFIFKKFQSTELTHFQAEPQFQSVALPSNRND